MTAEQKLSTLQHPGNTSEILVEHRRNANKKAEVLLYRIFPVVFTVSSLSTVTLFLPFLAAVTAPIVAVSIPVLIVTHAVLLRFWFVNPPRRQFSLSRRLISRWVPGLIFVILAPWGYGFMSVPSLGVFASPLVFVALTIFTHRYIGWQIQRQLESKPIHIVEKLFLVVLVGAAALSIVVFCAVAYGLGVLVEFLHTQIQSWI